MLAHNFVSAQKHGVGGWLMSEKLDGQRCFWDGGITRGILKAHVPWANTAKDERYVDTQIASGLWSRYGNVIHAPDSWLDALPKVPLDGELYSPDYIRQDLMSIIKKLVPGPEWKHVKLYAFGMPPFETIFKDGEIKVTNFNKVIRGSKEFLEGLRHFMFDYLPKPTTTFRTTKILLERYCSGNAIAHEQVTLPYQTEAAESKIQEELDRVTEAGGEGLIIRSGASLWIPERSHKLLKIKKLDDDEGIVTGYITGKKTDKGSKLLGLMGALILDYNGKRLELSGFTDQERELNSPDARQWAEDHPGQECPDWIFAEYFPRRTTVTFKFRGKTKDGIPQEARYWRKHGITW